MGKTPQEKRKIVARKTKNHRLMRKTLYWLASMACLCLVLAACSSEDDIKPTGNEKLVHITFTAGQAFTRTAIDGQDASVIDWQTSDTISILDGQGSRKFTLTEGAGSHEGVFDGMATETSIYTAVYPYQATGLTLKGNSVEGAVLPAVQTATAGTFDPKANLMMARTTENSRDLDFKNMTAFVKVTPQMDCQQISIVSADSTEALAGTMTMTLSDDRQATATIRANASHMVSLMGDIKAGSTYFIAVAPGTLAKGFRLGITTADGKHYGKDAKRSSALAANKVLNLGSIAQDKMNWLPYVTFSAEGEQSVTLNDKNKVIQSMEYSTDYGKHWSVYDVDKSYNFGKDIRVMLRGENPNGTAVPTSSSVPTYSYFSLEKTDIEVACTGDIRTIIAKEDYANADTKKARFFSLFNYYCPQLISAPSLPATELADNCYSYMFQGCKKLKQAPNLPATQLSNNCYACMFSECTSLTESPVLAAKDLPSHCYYWMFAGCSNLEKVTMLATSGDTNMGTNCLASWLDGTAGGTLVVAKGMGSNEFIKNNSTGWNLVEQE